MKLTINGVAVEAPGPMTILEAATLAGIEIPHYCYHPGLSVVGQCRMCQVEVERLPKLATACNTPAADGMVVRTATPKVEKARRAVLEFYLLNHPLDCPICDKGGECPLQDYTLRYGPGESRSAEDKLTRAKHRILGPHIVFDAERCILCTRCIRFCNEIPKTGELGVFSRGDRSEINVFPGRALDNAYSGNVIDLCPVGALTSREYRFKSRPWDLIRRTDSVCPLCSQGCNVTLDVRNRQSGDELLRIRPRENPAVNRWWMCDEGRFGFTPVHGPGRLKTPLWREAGVERPVGTADLVGRLVQALEQIVRQHGAGAVGCLVSARHTNEELFLVRRFFLDILRTPHLDHRIRPVQLLAADASEDGLLRRTDKTANGKGARDLGILPGHGGLDAGGMLQAAREGRLKALFVFEEDLVREFPGQPVPEALARLELLVVTSLARDATTALAHAVIPALSFAEKEGSFTNFQGRIQKLHRALPPPGAAVPLPELLRDVAAGLGWDLGDIEPERVWAAIGEQPGPYHGIGWREWQAIGPQGRLPEEVERQA
ncbi:MAG TPA: 2Fe-2S iron-sulfur cluster-binding protein [Candidatus Sulfotelmatobacter sp.]|nr:2Fe-2S iron-sulfur cluster-binding protein [Candidatus Sulfotelmatobacter sp.]